MAGGMTDRERVGLALKTEKDGGAFYAQASARTSHKLARAAFEVLAKEEERHVGLIEALGQSLIGKGGPVAVDSPTKGALAKGIKTIYECAMAEKPSGDLDAAKSYEKAIELEKRVSALYFEYARECESDEARRLFNVLYREEQDHLTLLEDMLMYLTKPDQWFIDKDYVMLDGG
ncbi:MAG: ferritin family protein [Candidatus Eisenbacteria bacterium]|nr:ferritin family protein [Candidatus Eisenbacteria bacterium]